MPPTFVGSQGQVRHLSPSVGSGGEDKDLHSEANLLWLQSLSGSSEAKPFSTLEPLLPASFQPFFFFWNQSGQGQMAKVEAKLRELNRPHCQLTGVTQWKFGIVDTELNVCGGEQNRCCGIGSEWLNGMANEQMNESEWIKGWVPHFAEQLWENLLEIRTRCNGLVGRCLKGCAVVLRET